MNLSLYIYLSISIYLYIYLSIYIYIYIYSGIHDWFPGGLVDLRVRVAKLDGDVSLLLLLELDGHDASVVWCPSHYSYSYYYHYYFHYDCYCYYYLRLLLVQYHYD